LKVCVPRSHAQRPNRDLPRGFRHDQRLVVERDHVAPVPLEDSRPVGEQGDEVFGTRAVAGARVAIGVERDDDRGPTGQLVVGREVDHELERAAAGIEADRHLRHIRSGLGVPGGIGVLGRASGCGPAERCEDERERDPPPRRRGLRASSWIRA
jgi:hypothetical protein